MTHLLLHESLGVISGVRGQGVTRYLGVKYGTLRHGFADAEMFRNEGGAEIKAHSYGPMTASPAACDFEQSLIQHSLDHEPFTTSTTECLTLNINVPDTAQKRLPVFVFLHGGGFAMGASSWPQYDLGRFVKLSADEHQPVIGISINYRLGAYGFLSSPELTALGCPPNRGLRDQRLAFQWVKAYIDGFGGDPNNVTVVGFSAGGSSALLHLESTEPLFERVAILGAGTPLGMKPIPPHVAEQTCSEVLGTLGITASDADGMLQGLLAVPSEEVVRRLPPSLPLHPVVDGSMIHHYSSFERWTEQVLQTVPGTKWCTDLFIGDCKHDVSIFSTMLGPEGSKGLGARLVVALREAVSDESVMSRILAEYDMDSSTDDGGSADSDEAALDFLGDVFFFAPVIKIASSWPGPAFVYHFNEPNPWDGPSHGKANHILDVAFLFQNYNHVLSTRQAQTARNQALDLIAFIRGKAPFSSYDGSRGGGARVYGPGLHVPGDAEDGNRPPVFERHRTGRVQRRLAILELVDGQGTFDRISAAWTKVVAG